ncbi:Hypothetical predicted protein, partial [Paramuricea clavata]
YCIFATRLNRRHKTLCTTKNQVFVWYARNASQACCSSSTNPETTILYQPGSAVGEDAVQV